MNKYLVIIITLLLCSSCAKVKWKKGWGPNQVADVKKRELKQNTIGAKVDKEQVTPVENWANEYYQKTYFVIQYPKLLETKEDLDKICSSTNKKVKLHYNDKEMQQVSFKTQTVTFTTRDGFSKKVFISKGVCRELALFKTKSLNTKRQIRKRIQKVTLSYLYNEGTFLKSIIFDSPYKNVKYLVE